MLLKSSIRKTLRSISAWLATIGFLMAVLASFTVMVLISIFNSPYPSFELRVTGSVAIIGLCSFAFGVLLDAL